MRANLLLFVGLRNKVEHRHERNQDALAAIVGGHAQALLLNYEEELTAQFGVEESLATRLRFPVFVGSFTTEGERALRRMRRRLPAALRTFVADYEAGLDQSTSGDPRFELRLRVLQELAPKDPDAMAMQFTRYDDLDEEQRRAVEAIGRKGMVVVRERKRDVVGHGLLRPAQVVAAVAAEIPFRFTMGQFTAAWRALGVRPAGGDPHPEGTDDKYCVYDERHGDYGYRYAFVRRLVRECSTEDGYRATFGTAPRDKDTGEWVGEPPASYHG